MGVKPGNRERRLTGRKICCSPARTPPNGLPHRPSLAFLSQTRCTCPHPDPKPDWFAETLGK